MEGNVHHMGVVLNHIAQFLRHIGKFFDNGTQLSMVKGLIGSAVLVLGMGFLVARGLGGSQSVVRDCPTMGGIVHYMGVVLHHIAGFLRHIGKFLDNGTQFEPYSIKKTLE